jgi:hypothetical protein
MHHAAFYVPRRTASQIRLPHQHLTCPLVDLRVTVLGCRKSRRSRTRLGWQTRASAQMLLGACTNALEYMHEDVLPHPCPCDRSCTHCNKWQAQARGMREQLGSPPDQRSRQLTAVRAQYTMLRRRKGNALVNMFARYRCYQ